MAIVGIEGTKRLAEKHFETNEIKTINLLNIHKNIFYSHNMHNNIALKAYVYISII